MQAITNYNDQKPTPLIHVQLLTFFKWFYFMIKRHQSEHQKYHIIIIRNFLNKENRVRKHN